MLKNAVIILLSLASGFAFSQNWVQVGLGGYGSDVKKLYTDASNNLLYAGGNFKTSGTDTIKGIAKWNGVKWDSLKSGVNYDVVAIAYYNSELYAGGGFTKAGGLSANHIAKWNGTSWSAIGSGVGNWVLDFHNYNSQLYVGGLFGYADTTSTMSIARRIGNAWYSVGQTTWTAAQIKTISDYNSEIYMAGQFNADTSNNILRWNGNKWHAVGQGIKSFSHSGFINKIMVFQNKLVIGGDFTMNDGNADNFIMQWNGSNFSTVGGGLNGVVNDMVVFNSKLYVVGAFSIAGGIVANRIAYWDGTNWCGLGSTFNGGVSSIEVYNNELYIGGSFTQIDGNNINYVAKWIGGNFTSSCGNTIGIKELSNPFIFSIYPNPVSDLLYIDLNKSEFQNSEMEITNYLGQTVLKQSFSKSIDVSKLSSGYYILKVNKSSLLFYSKFIKE